MLNWFRKLKAWLWRTHPEPEPVAQSVADGVEAARWSSANTVATPLYGVASAAPRYHGSVGYSGHVGYTDDKAPTPSDGGPDLLTTIAAVEAVESVFSGTPDPSPSFDSTIDSTPSPDFGGGDSGGAGASSDW